ncbi:MAG: putative phosphoglycerate [Desulfovibrionaceae bacterium]|nr:MAG: putative phosphoglycerate [Desulfovibrionaceae bacterium]
MTLLALIRHARTEWNAAGRIQGHEDSPLTPDGLEAARSWAGTLAPFNFSALYSSPLGRAMHTATVVGGPLGLDPVPVPDLREQAFGEWTGRTVAELRAQGLLAPQEALGWAFTPPGGEDRRAVLERAWNCLMDIAARHVGQSVLAVTHEGVLRALLYALKGRDYLPSEPKILAPRALHILRAQDGCLRIEAWNQTL